nr:retrovirus-related Pol polyprotein from transposon TNT 1-94 [Tanacetum cinerariifolium]
MLNTQMSANDKFGLGYGDYRYGSILSYENEVLQSVFMNKASDIEDTPVNDRYADGMYVVPPSMTGNYMPSGLNVEIDYSKFTYGPKQTSADESDSKPSEYASCESDSRNKAHLADYQEFKGGFVAFGGSNGRITSKGKIKTGIKESNTRPLVRPRQLFLPTTFWAEAVNTACYVLNRVLVTKPQNKTPYELLTSKQPIISYLRPFGCYVTIFNTVDQLGKFDGKYDLGFLVGYSLNSKAFRVYNLETKRVVENLHVNFLENKPNVTGKGHTWMFDLDYLTNSMNYEPVLVENQANKSAGPKEANNSVGLQANDDQGANSEEIDLNEEHFVLPIWSAYSTTVKISRYKIEKNIGFKTSSIPLSTASPSRAFNDGELSYPDPSKYAFPDDLPMPHPEDIYGNPNLPFGKKAIATKWIYRNERNEMGVVVRNKARLVTQGHRQDEGIEYDEVFAPVARMEAIRIFLAFASYMGFIVYQIYIKSSFLYGTINEEVYMSQPPSFVDLKFPNKVYKVVKALYGLHQASKAWYATLSTFLKKSRYRRGVIDKTFFIKQDKKDIMLVQVYVDDIIFCSTKKSWCNEFEELIKNSVKTASTPIKTQKPLVKDEEVAGVDVTPKTLHLYAVKRIFRYLKGQPKLGLWYPKVSSFDLEAYSDIDYAGANLDRKSTTGEAEYVATTHCCGQVLWIQNQLLDYKFNFMNTRIYIDNESTICIVKNLVFHSKTKHIEIRHHFIRDAYEKKLIQVLKIHTDDNVADLLTKAFDVIRSVSLLSKKKKLSKKESVSKQGRKNAKSGPTKDDRAKLDTKLDEDIEYMDTDEAVNKGRQSTVDTARPNVSTARPDDDTARPDVSTARQELSNADRLARLILTLKPLLKIDPKKGKGVLEEPESAKKMTKSDFNDAQIARDEEIARQLEVKLQVEVERERQREEQASMNYIANLYDEVQARIDVDHELAVRWTHDEQEKYTVDERAKLLAEYFERRKKQLAEERAVAIRNKPPTKNQLRRLMMTYLKNMGKFTHSQLNKKSFEDIQGLYMKEQELIVDFVPIGSEEDERMIRDMNKKVEEESSDKEALKEKEDLKTKVENWQNSSKNLNRLLNTQISANDKFGHGYGDYRYGSYIPSGPDAEIDYSKFTYGPKQTSVDESDAKTSENTSCESDSSVETPTSMPTTVHNAPKIVYEPKVSTDSLIFEEYESDGDDDSVSNVQEDKEKPSFAFTVFVKHI